MCRIIAAGEISSRPRCATSRPSRSTTTRSAQRVTSLSRCEMKMVLTPAAFSSAITSSSRSVSESVRLDVGSSMMTSAAVERQRLGDLQKLPLRQRQPRHRRLRPEVDPEPGEKRRRLRRHAPAVDQPERPAARLAADEDIAGHVEIVEEVEFLMHEGDPGGDRLGHGHRRALGTVDPDAAGRGRDDAAQHLHQRGLAGTVLADQPDHLARRHAEAYAVECDDAGVVLADADKLEKRLGHARSASPAPAGRGGGVPDTAAVSSSAADRRLQIGLELRRRWPCR